MAWPAYETGSQDIVHAMGVVSLNFNNLEWILQLTCLFWGRNPHPVTGFLFEKLSGPNRTEFVKKIAEFGIPEDHYRASTTAFAEGFDECAHNRNILMHSQLTGRTQEPSKITASKRTRSGGLQTFHFTADEIRRVADEIHAWYLFGNLTIMHAMDSQHGGPKFALPVRPPKPIRLEPQQIVE